MATVWEQIQEKRKKVESLKEMYRSTYSKAMSDGELSDQEKAQLAKIDAGVNKAQGIVKDLEEQFKANKKKWEGRDGDFSAMKSQYDELLDWDDPVCPDLKNAINETTGLAQGMAWLDAITRLEQGMVLVKAPYAEYQKQKPFEEKYNENHDKIADEGGDKKKHFLAKEPNIVNALQTFDNTMTSAETAAENRKYDDACRLLDDAKATADDIGSDLDELTEKHEKVASQLASVQGDAALYAASKYKTVQALNAKMAEFQKRIATHAKAYEYDAALTVLEVTQKALDEMKAEQQKNEQAEADWKATDPALQEAKKKAEEVKEFSGEDVGAQSDQADQAASQEDFEKATEQAGQAIQDAEEAHKEVQQKKAERASKLEDIQKQVQNMLADLGV